MGARRQARPHGRQGAHPCPPPAPPPAERTQLWKIYGTKALNDKFSRYRLAVERTRRLTEGNTCRRFHGTARRCRLGDDDRNRDLCTDGACSLCSIIAVRALYRRAPAPC
jgi:hypothetical protein